MNTQNNTGLCTTDLRLGNILHFDGELRKVSSLHNDNTLRFWDEREGSIGCYRATNLSIQPIELTKKWMERFDGEMIMDDGSWLLGGEIYLYSQQRRKFFHQKTGRMLAYVHQLQNFHFMLKGTELEYTKEW